jgi:hypothetical protein
MRTKPKLPQIEKENGFVLPSRFPQAFSQFKRRQWMLMFNAPSKLFDGS